MPRVAPSQNIDDTRRRHITHWPLAAPVWDSSSSTRVGIPFTGHISRGSLDIRELLHRVPRLNRVTEGVIGVKLAAVSPMPPFGRLTVF